MNPFLSKPLRKVQPGNSTEKRSAKAANKNEEKDKKDKNQTQEESPANNNINVISVDNIVKEEEKKEEGKNEIENKNMFISNIKEERSIEIEYLGIKSDGLVYRNDDEIFEYLKNKIKDGKIENITQKLEIKKSDFTGFTLSKKSNGFTIYEIEVEDNIDKINELLKKQRIEINKKQIEFSYIEDLTQPSKKSSIDIISQQSSKKPSVVLNNKIIGEKFGNKKPDSLITAMKNKIIEKQAETIKKDKMNDEIKNLQDKINKYKVDLKKEEEKENIINKSNRYVLSTLTTMDRPSRRESKINNKMESSAKESDRRMSKAYNRFKKAFSSKKDKQEGKGKINAVNSDKIASLAQMLKDHIIKPLAEIQEENEGGGKMYRGGSVECKNSKMGDEHFIKLLENAPITKKKVKKPKLNNFVE